MLSVFNGMGCAEIALIECGIKCNMVYTSEIDKHALNQTRLNFPNDIELGDVRDIDVSKLERIDLFVGGSPCQSFSFAGKRKGMATTCNEEIYTLERYMQLKAEGFEFEGQSYLFWEYMRILTDIRKYNPDVLFMLENVEMGNKWERVLSEAIGIYGVHINSALVSAQNRKRIYWFGQNRERFYYSENYCYICDNKRIQYEKEIRGIYDSTQRNGEESLLGKTQGGQVCLCSLQQGISKDRKERYYENMFYDLSKRTKEKNRQESEQGEVGRIPKKILSGAQGNIDTICKELSKDRCGEISNEESRFKFITNCQKENENSFKEGDRWNYSIEDERFNLNTKYETYMYCVCCGKELDYRSHNSVISYGDKRDYKSPSTLSKMQFEEARQNNGRVFDIYSYGTKGVESIFGETDRYIPQPADRGILLRDILESEVDEKYYLSDKMLNYFDKRAANFNAGKVNIRAETDKATTLCASMSSCDISDNFVLDTPTSVQKDNLVMQLNPSKESGGVQPYQQNRVYDPNGISPCLNTDARPHAIIELNERQQRNLKQLDDKADTFLSTSWKGSQANGMTLVNQTRIRRLTPTECARLQTVPDWVELHY